MKRPSPAPPRLAEPGACSNAVKMLSAASSGTPGPVSITLTVTPMRPSAVIFVETINLIAPSSVNLMAFEMRLPTICRTRPASTMTGASSAPLTSMLSATPLSEACGPQKSSVRRTRATMSVGDVVISSLPASIRETSSRSLTMASRPRPASSIRLSISWLSRSSSPRFSSSTDPRMALRGVRTSWPITAMKSDFALLAALAWSRPVRRASSATFMKLMSWSEPEMRIVPSGFSLSRARAENQR